ncbi:MAG: hypothetical protein ACR2HD_03245, partial [Solirubrobacteraceae bacterium]
MPERPLSALTRLLAVVAACFAVRRTAFAAISAAPAISRAAPWAVDLSCCSLFLAAFRLRVA